MVLLAILDIVSGAYALAAIEIVVPGIAVGVVVLVLRREQYRALGAAPTPARAGGSEGRLRWPLVWCSW